MTRNDLLDLLSQTIREIGEIVRRQRVSVIAANDAALTNTLAVLRIDRAELVTQIMAMDIATAAARAE